MGLHVEMRTNGPSAGINFLAFRYYDFIAHLLVHCARPIKGASVNLLNCTPQYNVTQLTLPLYCGEFPLMHNISNWDFFRKGLALDTRNKRRHVPEDFKPFRG